jgi:hypothetical protein
MRRKLKFFNVFQNMVVVWQMKVMKGIAFIKLHFIVDALPGHIEVFRVYWAHTYRWSPVRTVRQLQTVHKAIEWLMLKASRPLEEWGNERDLEAWLEAVKHTPMVYGLGRFRKANVERKHQSQRNQNHIPCPHCGNKPTTPIDVVTREEAWLYEKRYPPPYLYLRTDNTSKGGEKMPKGRWIERQVSNNGRIRFEKEGDEVTGVLKGIDEFNLNGNSIKRARIWTDDGEKSFLLTSHLDQLLSGVEPDTWIKVTFLGYQRTRSGRPLKRFQVMVLEPEEPELEPTDIPF